MTTGAFCKDAFSCFLSLSSKSLNFKLVKQQLTVLYIEALYGLVQLFGDQPKGLDLFSLITALQDLGELFNGFHIPVVLRIFEGF